ncbi:MAG: hypothetical protein F6K28_56500 [Microcoleus sp. SIO2G3]|nr:hypothetical protein [Microcoleus sp. SIO2G3]
MSGFWFVGDISILSGVGCGVWAREAVISSAKAIAPLAVCPLPTPYFLLDRHKLNIKR